MWSLLLDSHTNHGTRVFFIIQVSSKWPAVFLKETTPAACTVQLILHVAVTRTSMANQRMSKMNIFVGSKSKIGNCFKKKTLNRDKYMYKYTIVRGELITRKLHVK